MIEKDIQIDLKKRYISLYHQQTTKNNQEKQFYAIINELVDTIGKEHEQCYLIGENNIDLLSCD